MRRLTKAIFAVAAACRLLLTVAVGIGMDSEAPGYDLLRVDARRRASIEVVVGD